MKEYFKYVFPRIRTITEFHKEKGFCIHDVYRNRIQRKKKGELEPRAKMSTIHSVIRCKHNECKLCSIVKIPFTNVVICLVKILRFDYKPTIHLRSMILDSLLQNTEHVESNTQSVMRRLIEGSHYTKNATKHRPMTFKIRASIDTLVDHASSLLGDAFNYHFICGGNLFSDRCF